MLLVDGGENIILVKLPRNMTFYYKIIAFIGLMVYTFQNDILHWHICDDVVIAL